MIGDIRIDTVAIDTLDAIVSCLDLCSEITVQLIYLFCILSHLGPFQWHNTTQRENTVLKSAKYYN